MLLNKAINHMTMANASYASLLRVASVTGCVGVEVRNDLSSQLFDGLDAFSAGTAAKNQNLRLLALSEVSGFNDMSDRAFASVEQLASIAKECGAEAISLIPRNDGKGVAEVERKKSLSDSLVKFAPVLEQSNVMGYIEPLGFEQSSLRIKSEVVELLEELDLTHLYKLVHDTFHHYLAGGGPVFAEQTGMVHVSGVVDKSISAEQMLDHHRVLVDKADVLNNIAQLKALASQGYAGPVSLEAFSPLIHAVNSPQAALSESFSYIESSLVETVG